MMVLCINDNNNSGEIFNDSPIAHKTIYSVLFAPQISLSCCFCFSLANFLGVYNLKATGTTPLTRLNHCLLDAISKKYMTVP